MVPILLLLAFTVGMTTWLVTAVAKAGAPNAADTAVATTAPIDASSRPGPIIGTHPGRGGRGRKRIRRR